MGLRRWDRRSIVEALFDRDIVPANDLVRVEVVDNGERVQLVQAGHNTPVFNFRQPADVQYELGTSPTCRQLVARAFHVSIRQSESFAGLTQAETGMHEFLRSGVHAVYEGYNRITLLLRIRNSPWDSGEYSAFRVDCFLVILLKNMTSLAKFIAFRLSAFFLAMVYLFSGTRVCAQEAAVPPLSADAKVTTDAEFIAAADEVLSKMSEITGLKLRTPLKKSLRSREEIRAYVIKQMNEEKTLAERYAGARSAEAFGLIPKGFDLDAFMVNVLTEQVEGLYDPKTREFYIADWSPLSEQRMVMAHELTHALEDQHFQIEAWLKAARPNEDAELARDAVLEGSAMVAMIDYLMLGTGRSLKDLPEFDPSMLIGDLGGTPTLQKAPPFIRDALIFPYLGGLTFSAAILKDGGWSGLSGLFEKPPVSTQQILHPTLYRSSRIPQNVTLPALEKLFGNNWSKLDENVLGEFGWKEVLKQFLDDTRAKNLAASWAGDKYALYEEEKSKRMVLVTRLRLDSEEHATRFSGQYSEALEKKYTDRSNLFRRPNFFSFDSPEGGVFLYCFGVDCVTMEGATRQTFDGFTRALRWPLALPPAGKLDSVPSKTTVIFPRLEDNARPAAR